MSDESVRKFKISAPGRIVLSGEHSALYGKPFIMAGLNLRTNLEFCELRDGPSVIRIEFSNVNLLEEIPLIEIEALICYVSFSDDLELLENIKRFITTRGMWHSSRQRFSLLMFFLILRIMVRRENLEMIPFHVRVSSEIPIGAGLGSSMSFAVCLAGCFLHWKRLQSGPHIQFDDDDLSLIKKHTEFCEKFMQNYDFAKFDAEVCTHGKIQKCQIMNYNSYSSDIIDLTREMRILLLKCERGYTKEKRELHMAQMNKSDEFFINYLNELEEATTTIYDNLNRIKDTTNNYFEHADAYEDLVNSIGRNHLILETVTTSRIKSAVAYAVCRKYNLKGKVAGFRGEFVYFVLPPRLSSRCVKFIRFIFRMNDVKVKFATINCEGVTIHN